MRIVVDGEMTKVLLGLMILAGAASTACATANAKTAPERPTLEVPAPPAKVIEKTPMPETMPDLVPDLPQAPPANTRTSKPSSREPARTDPKPEATTAATETPAAPVPPVSPPPQLRPGGTPEASEAAKQAQIAFDRAKQAITSINLKQLGKTKRPVYDDALRMLATAEDALKKSDFDNAKKLAQKVEDTARELGAR
jgi:hypothetical protein